METSRGEGGRRPLGTEVPLIAGHLALEFVNAMGDARFENLSPAEGYRVLVCWARHVGILCPTALDFVDSESAERRAEAEAVLARAHVLARALFSVFARESRHEPPDPRDAAILNDELAAALCRRRLVHRGGEYRWSSRGGDMALEVMLWPISYQAAELLVSEDSRWVKVCQGEGCRQLFLDTSRGRNRRWCAMGTCGNRAKARRHYAKKQHTHSDSQAEN